jgi:putative peptidoglycan lipid II flippase
VVDLSHPDFRKYLWLSLPLMIGQSIVVVDDWFIKRFGSLVATGVVAQLQYAKTLMRVPMGVFGVAIGAGLYPTVTRLVAQGQVGEAYGTLIRAVRAVLVLALATGAGLIVAGTEVATVIWGTARFSPAELQAVGTYTAVLCLGLWAWATATVFSRGFYALERTWLPTALGTAVTLCAWPLYKGLAASYGGLGLAWASSISLSVYVTGLAIMLRRTMAPDSPERVGGTLLRMAVAMALGVGAGLGLESVLPELPALIRGALSGGTAAVSTLTVAALLGVAEVKTVTSAVVRRLRR